MPLFSSCGQCPKQPGGVECGYYVMRYMKDIIEDTNLEFESTVKSNPNDLHVQYIFAYILA